MLRVVGAEGGSDGGVRASGEGSSRWIESRNSISSVREKEKSAQTITAVFSRQICCVRLQAEERRSVLRID
jgi:hypothetical protein